MVTQRAWGQLAALGVLLIAAVGLVWLDRPWFASWVRQANLAPAQATYPYTDYAAFLNGARLVANGQGAALYKIEAQRAQQRAEWGTRYDQALAVPYVNPPWFAVALLPLTGLPLGLGYLIWVGGCVALVLGAVGLLVGWARPPPLVAAAFVLVPFSFLPVWRTLLLGQTSALVLFGLAGTVVATGRGRDGWAGLALALAGVKPHLIILPLLVLACAGRWRAIAVCAGASAVGWLAPLLLTGPGILPDYLALLGSPTYAGYENLPQLQTWRAFLAGTLGLTGLPATLLWLAGAAAVGWLVVRGPWPVARGDGGSDDPIQNYVSTQPLPRNTQPAIRNTQYTTRFTFHVSRFTRPRPIPDLAWALALLGTVWVVPHVHLHDLVIGLVPAAAGLRYLYRAGGAAQQRQTGGWVALWAGWAGVWPAWLVPDARLAVWGSALIGAWVVAAQRREPLGGMGEDERQAWNTIPHPR
jgi:hypothetical protein